MAQPNPELAVALRSMEIPPQLSNTIQLRDYLLNVAENGMSAEAGVDYLQQLLHLVVFAQLESTSMAIHLNETVRQLDQNMRTVQATLKSWEAMLASWGMQ